MTDMNGMDRLSGVPHTRSKSWASRAVAAMAIASTFGLAAATTAGPDGGRIADSAPSSSTITLSMAVEPGEPD